MQEYSCKNIFGWFPNHDLLRACWGEGMNPFVLSPISSWVTYLFFEVWILSHFALFCRTMVYYSGHVSVFTIWQTSWNKVVVSFFVTEAACYSPSDYVFFGQDHLFFANGPAWHYQLCCVILSNMLNVYHFQVHLLFFWPTFSSMVWALDTVSVTA